MRSWRGSPAVRARPASLTELVAISPTRAESLAHRCRSGDLPRNRGRTRRSRLARNPERIGRLSPSACAACSTRRDRARARQGDAHQGARCARAPWRGPGAPRTSRRFGRGCCSGFRECAARGHASGAARRTPGSAAHLSAALRHGVLLTLIARAELLESHALENALANQTRDAIASAPPPPQPGASSAMLRRRPAC